MSVTRIVICLSLCVLVSCSGKGVADPTYLLDGYTGITYTNEIGENVGPIDLDDWRVSDDTREYQDSGTPILPSKFAVRPAFPNPFNPQFNLLLEFPIASSYSITVLDFRGRVVESDTGASEAGSVTVVINLRSEEAGVYRVFYAFSGLNGYGDVWLVTSGSGIFE